MKLFYLLVVLLAVCSVSMATLMPIPQRPDGFPLLVSAPASSPVVLDAFFDLLCPDSAAAWPVVKQVVAAYPTQLYFLMHTFSLPYHTNAFIANQGAHVVDRHTMHNLTAVAAYADLIFSVQAAFFNAATKDKTITQVIAALATNVEQAGLLSASDFTAGIADTDINMDTRISWKYGCSRGITGTASFLLNGVFVPADGSWTLDQWKAIIDPLLSTENRLARS